MELENKRVVVVGLGKSGISAARLARGRGAHVIGTDAAQGATLGPELGKLGIELALGGHDGVDFSKADLVVVSPGVPALPELDRAAAAGVEVIGEMELASRFLDAPIAAVGGTNGKSTTATLLAKLLESDGKRVFAGANLGTPACDAPGQDWDAIVFEVSSFQLERVPTFRPKVSVLLNVTEDHLDRYASFEDYARAKGNAFVNQKAGDFGVVPEGDAVCLEQARRGQEKILTFGKTGDYELDRRTLVERESGTKFSLAEVDLHGRHNLDNAAAAIAAARVLGASPEGIARGLREFTPLSHRMALVGRVTGVTFYDDSKGTNVGASVTALLGLTEERAVLIAGGRDKLGSYDPLVQALERRGRGAVLIGEASERMAAAIGDRVPVWRATNMEQAVGLAFQLARQGDAVLLSPACSSFDMFKSYADRGERFVAAVQRLVDRLSRKI